MDVRKLSDNLEAPVSNTDALKVYLPDGLYLFQQASKWLRLKEMLTIAMTGGRPSILSGRLYRLIMGKFGRGASIQGLGKVQRDVSLHTFAPSSQIDIGKGVYLNRVVVSTLLLTTDIAVVILIKNTVIELCACIHGLGHIPIGNACLIASHVGIFANDHNFSDPEHLIMEQNLTYEGIEVGDDYWLRAGAKVLDGFRVG